MNDASSSQLCETYLIPDYARPMLHLAGESDEAGVPLEGEHGVFQLSYPSPIVTLRWGAQGAGLLRLRFHSDGLAWNGLVGIGGFIEAMHVEYNAPLEAYTVVMSCVGWPLFYEAPRTLSASQRMHTPYPLPDFYSLVDRETEPQLTTWLLDEESPLMAFMQDALHNKAPIVCYGRLADAKTYWAKQHALPLLLESVTLYGR